VPGQSNAMTAMTVRAGTGEKRLAMMAACGIHHATKFLAGFPSQSREASSISSGTVHWSATSDGPGIAWTVFLNRRARHRAIGAEHATIA
jgi:hypothetical protein